MQKLSAPLAMTEAENREALAASEKCFREMGDPEGNRHARRLAAKRERQEQKRARLALKA